MITVQEAQSIISNNIQPLGFETVSLKKYWKSGSCPGYYSHFPHAAV